MSLNLIQALFLQKTQEVGKKALNKLNIWWISGHNT
jgi:hypothetical protein